MALTIASATEDADGTIRAVVTEPVQTRDPDHVLVTGTAVYNVSVSVFQQDGVTRRSAAALVLILKALAAAQRRAAATARADLLG